MNDRAQDKTVSMTVLMTPAMANFSGNVHGGDILALLDKVAYACAARYGQALRRHALGGPSVL
jgi:acyl-CoA hydrolase